jgi:hypothetical protein
MVMNGAGASEAEKRLNGSVRHQSSRFLMMILNPDNASGLIINETSSTSRLNEHPTRQTVTGSVSAGS